MYLKVKKLRYIVLLLISALLLSSGVWAAQETSEEKVPAPKKIIRHVVFVNFDGVMEQGIEKAYTPNLNGLASSGIYAPAMDVLPPDNAYHLAAVLSGADTEINGFKPEKKGLEIETLPETFIKYGREAEFVVSGKSGSGEFLKSLRSGPQIQVVKGNDSDVVNAAMKKFEKNRPYFLGLVLSGAAKSGSTAEYYKSIGEVDEQLGRLLIKLKDLDVYEETLIILTGSNNVKQFRISGLNDGRMFVPVVLKGPGLKSGSKLSPVRVIDVAPTVSMLTGVTIPNKVNGMVIWNGLLPGAGFVEEHLLQKRIKELSEGFMKSTGDIYQLQEEKRTVHSEKEQIRKEKQEIQSIIDRKDSKISSLTNRIRLMQMAGLIILILSGLGYIVEYKYLKKKFLMF